jgi:hypothetical protein
MASKAIDDAIEQAVKKATDDAIKKAIADGASKEAAEAAGKLAADQAREAAVKAATDAVAAGTASEAQKTLAKYASEAKDFMLKNPKLVIGGITAATVAYHMYQNGETDPAKAIAEMAGGDVNDFLGTLFGPFKNWILGGLGVILLGLLIFLIYKLFEK